MLHSFLAFALLSKQLFRDFSVIMYVSKVCVNAQLRTLYPHFKDLLSLQQACMYPNAQTTEWNILLSKYHIYLNTWYTKLNTSKKQGIAKITTLQK